MNLTFVEFLLYHGFTAVGKDGLKMAIEMINSIKNAEAEAAQIKNVAKEKAKNIIAKAHEKSKADADKSEKDAYDKANAMISEAKRKADEISLKQGDEFSAKIAASGNQAEAKLDTAADFILKELFDI